MPCQSVFLDPVQQQQTGRPRQRAEANPSGMIEDACKLFAKAVQPDYCRDGNRKQSEKIQIVRALFCAGMGWAHQEQRADRPGR